MRTMRITAASLTNRIPIYNKGLERSFRGIAIQSVIPRERCDRGNLIGVKISFDELLVSDYDVNAQASISL